MFARVFEKRVPEGIGDTLWNQCLQELQRINYTGKSISIEEVDRLVAFVSHRVRGDFTLHVQETAAEAINGFMDDLPF